MRDKKVRAWDKVGEEYLYSGKFPSMWQFYLELESRGIRDWETEDYTGLHDKNSVEIYEGDIMRARYLRGNAVVFYDEGLCGYELGAEWDEEGKYYNSTEHLLDDRTDEQPESWWEVIGNIYLNKELLK